MPGSDVKFIRKIARLLAHRPNKYSKTELSTLSQIACFLVSCVACMRPSDADIMERWSRYAYASDVSGIECRVDGRVLFIASPDVGPPYA